MWKNAPCGNVDADVRVNAEERFTHTVDPRAVEVCADVVDQGKKEVGC